ncbi:NAD(P)H-binding protein [Shewanella corallii]|uniref:NAD(P)H-binding protein n=1 Tax=Shewanella corallii TaxID=560080 RepID=A0ABT0N6K3_9GAMM|nr:NAD(P)H-binding protein [Shewanella corallii]MCL2914073.1 NAD(P)H-binding protein [Shewanella corallii]
MNKIVMLIAGSTGLTGQELVKLALETPQVECLATLSRRPLPIEHSKLTQYISNELTADGFSADNSHSLVGVICLGTTIKQAGSKEKLKAIDVDLVVATAANMRQMGVEHIVIVSCLGANPRSFSHYLRCKGEMEQAVTALNFKRTTFLQPGPLAGDRQQTRSDEKLLQAVAKVLKPLAVGRLANYLPIQAETVAEAIIQLSLNPTEVEVSRVTSSQMQALVKESAKR